MTKLTDVLHNFFTHKDFLPPTDQWPGTLFTPLQIAFCVAVAVFIVFACLHCSKQDEKYRKKVFFILWLVMAVSEPLIIRYDCCAGSVVKFEWNSVLSLWTCSIFLYTAPFAIFGKGDVKYAACGHICTLGLLGGLINFVYPANYLSYYSCISMVGFRTIFYHGAMVFVAVTMLLSGYHSYKDVKSKKQLLLPMVPALLVSIPANIVNFTVPGADYMFFKLESFFFAPIGKATPDWFSVILVYIFYGIVHILPYLPTYIKNNQKAVR